MNSIEQKPEFAKLESKDKCQVLHIIYAFEKTWPEKFDYSEKSLAVQINVSPSEETLHFIKNHFLDLSKWKGEITHRRTGGGVNVLFFYLKNEQD